MNNAKQKFYSVETHNSFGALGGDDSDDERIAPVTELLAVERQAAAASAEAMQAAAKPAPENKKSASASTAARRPRTDEPRRAPRTPPTNNAAEMDENELALKPPRQLDAEGKARDKEKPQRRGGHVTRGKEVKRAGGGHFNWGNQAADYGAEDQPTKVRPPPCSLSISVFPPQPVGESGEMENGESPVAAEQQQQNANANGAKIMSLGEYKAAQEAEKVALGHVEIKEDEVTKRMMQGYVEMKREDDEGQQLADKKQKESQMISAGKKQTAADINFRFTPNRPNRRDNQQDQQPHDNQQTRSRPPRSPKSPKQPDLSDAAAFPTLQAH